MVAQSGGPTAVINASLSGVIKEALEREEIGKVYGAKYGVEGVFREDFINLRDTILEQKRSIFPVESMDIANLSPLAREICQEERETEISPDLMQSLAFFSRLATTPASALGSCRRKLHNPEEDPSDFDMILHVFKKWNIGYFLYIGGNDSMDTAWKLSLYFQKKGEDIRVIGVPKTIDNDLYGIDHCPGYASSVKYISSCLLELEQECMAYDKNYIMIVEMMGRNAGWLTAAAALAKNSFNDGADFILLPEIGLNLKEFINILGNRLNEKNNIVVAVSEGIKDQNGNYISEDEGNVDVFGHKMLSGTAAYLAKKIKSELGVKTRAVEINTLQRAAAHLQSKTDIDEAFNIGFLGVKAGIEGETGVMMYFDRVNDAPYLSIVRKCDINLVANIEKEIPRGWISEDGFGVNEKFIEYAKPLITGELSNIVCEGIQSHIISLK